MEKCESTSFFRAVVIVSDWETYRSNKVTPTMHSSSQDIMKGDWKLNWDEPRFCARPDEIINDPGIATLFGITVNDGDEEEEEELLAKFVNSLQSRIEMLRILNKQYRSNRIYFTVFQEEIILGEIGVFKGNSWIYIKCYDEGFFESAKESLEKAAKLCCRSIITIKHSEELLLKYQECYYFTVCSGGEPLGTLFQLKLFCCGNHVVVAKALVSYAVDDGPTLELIECYLKGQGLGSILLKCMEGHFLERNFPDEKLYIDHAIDQSAKLWYENRGYLEYSIDSEKRMYKVLTPSSQQSTSLLQ